MRLRDAAYFLVGDRDAIVALAGNRWTLAVGAFLVLTASVARNYDGAYLPAEWTVLTHGYAASIGNAFVLFAAVFAFARFTDGRSFSFGKGYLAFLGLFWMTSPLAWLYAIPYERFLTPVGAIEANLWTLALVAAWRVILISRVLSVLFDLPLLPVLLLAAFWADVILFAATQLMPAPVVDFMGGLQHTDEDALLSSVRFTVMMFSFLGMFVLGVAALIGLYWLRTIAPLAIEPSRERPSRGVLAACAVVLLAGVAALAYGQPEQYRRYRAESLLRAGDVAEAFAFMSRHDRSAFPAIWDPPPRVGYMETLPDISAIRTVLVEQSVSAWVREAYLEKSWRWLGSIGWYGPRIVSADEMILMYENSVRFRDSEKRSVIEGLRFHADHDERFDPDVRYRLRDLVDRLEAPAYPPQDTDPPD